MKAALAGALADADLQVKLTALNATVQYLADVNNETRNQAADLVPMMLNVGFQPRRSDWLPSLICTCQFLPPLATNEHEDSLAEALGYLVELAELAPKLFRPIVSQVIQFVGALMANEELSDSEWPFVFPCAWVIGR